MLRKYDLRKHLNTFKARSQTPVNKHNPTCGMCYCVLRLIPILTDMVKKILLGSRYDQVLFTYSKFVGIIMLGNQYKYIAFNIFSGRIYSFHMKC